jgi:hypothetical protein
MYIETVPNRNSPSAILLRQGWREGNKTRKRTLANLSPIGPRKKSRPSAAGCATNPSSLPKICSLREKLCPTAMS